ncbi:hypothetical protein H5410_053902 [Solanum commersonii]|uniref:peptidylprolyl isomerase n=1 Tax=Solanum commersonii TaxID=4109 RepID=A0A9J5X545_SOLCO|nr:hypothetical protein H5410_053902 [Solanum commersonii]
MEKLEIPCEFPSRGTKREALINDSTESESEESDYSIGYDSDDPSFEILEGKADGKIWKQYFKEWDESEGFDISVHPGSSSMAGIEQLHDYLKDSNIKQEYTELCELAIHDFNLKNVDNTYAFKEIVNVNASYAAGTWYYFTFTATDTTVEAAVKTFQAAVWHGFDETINVHFCRLKKFLSNEDKKKKKKKSQQDGKAKLEQDEPSFVKSSVPGLVIEELSKGKSGGKKAYTGFKVGVRYTGKLMENEKIFDTNIGKEDPLEFRIAGGQVIQGWEIGVIGMRVGDKRRITIPPDFGFGDEGYFDVVPPDSWLVFETELIYIK